MKVAIYARVSRLDQEPENQLHELRRYVQARVWEAVEFVEHGVFRREGSPAGARRDARGGSAAAVRRDRLLEAGSAGPEHASSGHAAR